MKSIQKNLTYCKAKTNTEQKGRFKNGDTQTHIQNTKTTH